MRAAMTAAAPPPQPPPHHPTNRHKMVLLTWVGIWPTITAVLSLSLPALLARFPLPIVTLIVTAAVVPLMGYVVMPLLVRAFGGWLRR
jgi:antibiotic biosynthesis monooxygenase (ABM) superfamily enzyme